MNHEISKYSNLFAQCPRSELYQDSKIAHKKSRKFITSAMQEVHFFMTGYFLGRIKGALKCSRSPKHALNADFLGPIGISAEEASF